MGPEEHCGLRRLPQEDHHFRTVVWWSFCGLVVVRLQEQPYCPWADVHLRNHVQLPHELTRTPGTGLVHSFRSPWMRIFRQHPRVHAPEAVGRHCRCCLQIPPSHGGSSVRTTPPFFPKVDGEIVFDDYLTLSSQYQFAKIPYLHGHNDLEQG